MTTPATAVLAGEVLAHAGGWDEILMVAAPLAVIGALLFLADRRARNRARDDEPG